MTVMSGGYGAKISETVEIHCNTIRVVRSIFESDEAGMSSKHLSSLHFVLGT